MTAASGAQPFPLGPVSSNWSPPGPLSLRYLLSTSPIVLVMGPVGSAKTSTSFMKAFRNVKRQPKSIQDGVKRIKTTVVCDTYKNLHNKAVRTFEGIVPRDHPSSSWRGGKGEDLEVKLYITLPDGTPAELFWHFIAVGDKNIDSITAGLMTTDVYLYEADKLPEQAIDEFAKRLGRYPELVTLPDGEFIKTQLYGDFNAPEETNAVYQRLAFGNMPSDEFIVYPSGFDPKAENLANLQKIHGKNYYQVIAQSMADDALVKRQIENKPGYSRAGSPVYTDYSNEMHTAEFDLTPQGDLPLIIGVDGGGDAAAVICQPLYSGGLDVLAEIVTPRGEFTNAEDFGALVAKVLSLRFPNRAAIAAVDPANMARSSARADQASWFQIFQKASGVMCYPAMTNNPGHVTELVTQDTRIGAVRTYLRRMADGKPAFQVNRDCIVLREGFTSGYILRKVRQAARVEFKDAPDKNSHYSHVHDALQYACLMALNSRDLLQNAMIHSATMIDHTRYPAPSQSLVINR